LYLPVGAVDYYSVSEHFAYIKAAQLAQACPVVQAERLSA
jgi:hypothetical protein